MLVVAREYAPTIDDITTKRGLNLQSYELSDEEWNIVDDSIHVLKVHILSSHAAIES